MYPHIQPIHTMSTDQQAQDIPEARTFELKDFDTCKKVHHTGIPQTNGEYLYQVTNVLGYIGIYSCKTKLLMVPCNQANAIIEPIFPATESNAVLWRVTAKNDAEYIYQSDASGHKLLYSVPNGYKMDKLLGPQVLLLRSAKGYFISGPDKIPVAIFSHYRISYLRILPRNDSSEVLLLFRNDTDNSVAVCIVNSTTGVFEELA